MECACQTRTSLTYNAFNIGEDKIVYGGHYHCGAVRALGKGYGSVLTWEGGKVIKKEYVINGEIMK